MSHNSGRSTLAKGCREFFFNHKSETWKKVLVLITDAFSLSLFSIFVAHEYLQRVDAEFFGLTNLSCHVYPFPDEMPVHDSIIYAYSWNLQTSGPGKGNRANDTKLSASNEETVLKVSIEKTKHKSKTKNILSKVVPNLNISSNL